ncbi:MULTISPECIES: threonine synthase [unclassified Spirosoma]|uniref:threonine synthase n=1 Tax=unclassified Spirosoma TaxID=2621999 RepID=UPI0009697429|nr:MULTISPECIES: threonine synthase [unclassified Spirosoma]MBN8826058.1 threonine synthase [Spirosoma sp.]OJW75510.1 MAG: threonine synthase [Spirosoma sp. 48-14]
MNVAITSSLLGDLHCSQCGKTYDPFSRQTVSRCCQAPLLCDYVLDVGSVLPGDLASRPKSLWRYEELLPGIQPENRVSLGEGFTPILTLNRLASQNNLQHLLLKDEGLNPTGSFKARGLSMAISKAKENGEQACIIPTAGNAGVAMAAYCARAGMEAVVVMPRHTPDAFKEACRAYNARLIEVDGLINDCAANVQEINQSGAYFDVSTLKEPYRLEGKKTMGFEIAEQLAWQLPDVIVYPTGGGTGLIGIWKAFDEMQSLGWLPQEVTLPRMVAVQAESCCPIVTTWQGKQLNSKQYVGRPTLANGLAVPRPIGEPLILSVLLESGGTAIAVSDEEMVKGVRELARYEGIFGAPEGGAVWAATKKLLEQGWIQPNERVLLLNTGSGQSYLDNLKGKLTD